MDNNTRKIKKRNYYIMSALIIFQLLFFYDMFHKYPFYQLFMHMTNWSFTMSTIYLFLILIFDTNLYFFSSEKLEKLNFFIRNSYSKIAFTFCFMITVCYWLYLIFGTLFKINMYSTKKPKYLLSTYLFNTYLHLGITIIMVLDLYLMPREEVKLTKSSFIINTLIYLFYLFCTYVQRYIKRIDVYVFMKGKSLGTLIFLAIITYGIIIGCFFIYMILANKINYIYIQEIKNQKEYNKINNQEMKDKIQTLNELMVKE